jgi:tRNA A-37 threonylcarbamoyl transferase component Bud32
VDNAYNRKLGRVGMPLGTRVVSISGACAMGASAPRSGTGGQRCYVDNPYNRKLGRVGKPLGSHVISKRGSVQKLVNEHTLQDLVDALRGLGFSDANRPRYEHAVYILERERVEESWRSDGIRPSTDVSRLTDRTSGEIIPYSELKTNKKPIGRGGYGEVYAGQWHGTPIAFKKLLYQHISRKLLNNFTKEMRILAALNHPNTVKMFGAVVEEGNIGIVMEYMSRSLYRALFWDEPQFPKEKKKQVITQIASALEYLHTNDKEKIAHCDIKSENILLDHADNAKLTDFGISVIKSATQTSLSTAGGPAAPPGLGTPRYSAPEVLRGELLSMVQLLRTDIYSLSLVVFELLTEEEPFEGLNYIQLQANVGRGSLRPCAPDIKLSRQVLRLLERCWDGDASKRPTAVEFNREWSSITVLVED